MLRGDLRRALALVRRRTQRGPLVHVRLMETADCGLCAEAHRALRRIALERPLDVERVDITTLGAADHARYALRVPVLVVRGDELDAAGLDDAAIVRWLQEVDRSGQDGPA